LEMQTQLALTDPEDVAMGIGQAGNDGVTTQIDSSRGVKFPGIVVRAHEHDAILSDRNRLGLRRFFVNRVNISVEKKQVDILGCAQLQNRSAEQCQEADKRNARFHLTLPRSFDVIIWRNGDFSVSDELPGIEIDMQLTRFSFAERISIYRVMASMRAHPERDLNSFLSWRPCWPGPGRR